MLTLIMTLRGFTFILQAVHNKGAALQNCWAFIDGTARPICRPSEDQHAYFSGHKRLHVLKYQAVMCANGLVCDLDGPYPGRRHDAGETTYCYFVRMLIILKRHKYVTYKECQKKTLYYVKRFVQPEKMKKLTLCDFALDFV